MAQQKFTRFRVLYFPLSTHTTGLQRGRNYNKKFQYAYTAHFDLEIMIKFALLNIQNQTIQRTLMFGLVWQNHY